MTEEKMKDGKRAITKQEAIENFKFLPEKLKRKILVSPELTETERMKLHLRF